MTIISKSEGERYAQFKSLQGIKIIKKEDKNEQKDFLKELKGILGVENPITKTDIDDSLKSLEEICGNYIFTFDNFLNMVLILLKLKAKIPVIIMGNSCSGKTSLIKKLSELKNNGESKMKILKLHPGIDENDIADFIKKVIKSKKDEDEDEDLWVLLDEINKCNSLGLIKELICDHKCFGTPIPSNIIFIGTYNQYGKDSEQKEGLEIKQPFNQLKGLNIKQKVQFENKNYKSNIKQFPYSLSNYVFNIGDLDEKDENEYIKMIIKQPIKHL